MSDATWTRIDSWLAANAAKIIGNLNPPASDGDLSHAEATIGAPMPDGLRDLYRRHNGLNDDDNHGSLFYGMHFVPLAELVDRHSRTAGEPVPVRAADDGIDMHDILNPEWITFAHDFGDCSLCVDLAPAAGGTIGQVIFTDQADSTAIWLANGIEQFLAEFAGDLELNKYFLNSDALDEGNHFLDCIPEIDILNWVSSPRWQHLSPY